MKLTFDVIKFRTPLRYPIGDRDISISVCDWVAISIKDLETQKIGWGYALCMTEGYFKVRAWYQKSMPSETNLRQLLIHQLGELWNDKTPAGLTSFGDAIPIKETWLRRGVDMALRDLQGKLFEKSIYQLLGGKEISPQVKAYGSLLDFSLDEAATLEKLTVFLKMGVTQIKVKIGAIDPNRDIRRLQLVQSHLPEKATLSADVNSAWTLQSGLEISKKIKDAGIDLAYVEDPLLLSDTKDYPAFKRESPFKVAAHDYIERFEELETLILSGGVDYIRSSSSLSIHQQLAPLAAKHHVPIIYGNSNMELNTHSAAALPGTHLIEYSHLDYNVILKNPIQIHHGYLQLPTGDGFGLDPDENKINDRRYPQESLPIDLPCPWSEN